MSLKLIKKHAPQIKWVISFADACSCGDGTIYRASNFVLTGIKENLNLAELPDGSRVHKMTLASNPTSPRKELGGLTFFDVTGGTYNFKKYLDYVGATPIPGYQLRYIYFIDKSKRKKMLIQKVSAARLNPAAYNPRRDLKPGDKDYEKLKRSIEEFGFVEPVVWNKATGNVVGGHQRLKVLLDMGETEIDCVVVDLDPQKEKALNLALNRIQGGWDESKLAELMADLDASSFDVSFTGFDAEEIDALMNKFYSAEATEDDFDQGQAAADIEAAGGATTRPGDIWLLGEHRLMCGDSTSEDDFVLLMDGAHAQCAVTSPPYGVGKKYEKAGIEPWFETVRPVIKNICKHAEVIIWQMIDLYCTGTQFIEPTGLYSVQIFAENGYRPLWIRIWKKQGCPFGPAPYHLVTNKPAPQYEYITAFSGQETEDYNEQEYAWISAFAGHSYKFTKRLTKDERKKWGYAGIWEISTVRANKEHPAMFPVELPWRCIKMHSDPGGIVLEPFCGSGTTLIAAEQTGRRCYAMEISPLYCDLTVMRWEQFTGQKARRVEII